MPVSLLADEGSCSLGLTKQAKEKHGRYILCRALLPQKQVGNLFLKTRALLSFKCFCQVSGRLPILL